MVLDLIRNLLVAFPLVADVDETVIHAHLEFGWSLIPTTLVLVKLLQTLQRYANH